MVSKDIIMVYSIPKFGFNFLIFTQTAQRSLLLNWNYMYFRVYIIESRKIKEEEEGLLSKLDFGKKEVMLPGKNPEIRRQRDEDQILNMPLIQ
jgi:hypothetical protein